MTPYEYRHAVSAFFELPREVAARCLHGSLEPLEPSHGIGVLAVTAFDFTDSEVGAYQELVLSILTPPRVSPDGDWPRSAFFPFIVATSTEASRAHAIERWRLPHYPGDIAIEFEAHADRIGIRAHERGRPVLDLDVSGEAWGETHQLYQLFSASADQLYNAEIHMRGFATEHEEETGRVVLHDHPMCAGLAGAEVSRPFRELWLRNGVQSIDTLKLLS